ncbi:MAG: flavin reductase family protein [Anaerolineae bacterium]
MQRVQVAWDYRLVDTLARLQSPGLLLASTKRSGESNVMTISWGQVGIIWNKPIFTVLVRPSRYTYEFIEDSGVFTLGVPTEEMRRWVAVCGARSGREMDKFAAYGIGATPGIQVPAVTLDPCPLVFECRVVHTNDLIPANLDHAIEADNYGGSNYHRLYFGEIMGAYAHEGY